MEKFILISLASLIFIFSLDFVSGACNTNFGYCDETLPQVTPKISGGGISTTINNNTYYINNSEQDPFFIQENASLWDEAKKKSNTSYIPYLNANSNPDFNGKNLLNISGVMAIALYPLNYLVGGTKAYLGAYGSGATFGYAGWGYNTITTGWDFSPDNVLTFADLGIDTINGSCSGSLIINCEDIVSQSICDALPEQCIWDGDCKRIEKLIPTDYPRCWADAPIENCTIGNTNNKCRILEGECIFSVGETELWCSDISESVCNIFSESYCDWVDGACVGKGLTECSNAVNNQTICETLADCSFTPNTWRNGYFWGNITSNYFFGNGKYLTNLPAGTESDPFFIQENVSIWNEAKNKANSSYAIKMDYNATSNLNMSNKNISGIDKMYNASGQEFTLTDLNRSSASSAMNYTNLFLLNQSNNVTKSIILANKTGGQGVNISMNDSGTYGSYFRLQGNPPYNNTFGISLDASSSFVYMLKDGSSSASVIDWQSWEFMYGNTRSPNGKFSYFGTAYDSYISWNASTNYRTLDINYGNNTLNVEGSVVGTNISLGILRNSTTLVRYLEIRPSTSPVCVAGTIIYNSSINKHQGCNGTWNVLY